jgi:hypothetical protein
LVDNDEGRKGRRMGVVSLVHLLGKKEEGEGFHPGIPNSVWYGFPNGVRFLVPNSVWFQPIDPLPQSAL